MIAVFHAQFHHRSFLIFKLFEYFDYSTSTESLSSVSSAAMPKRRSATQRTSRCFRSLLGLPGRMTPENGNRGPSGIDASPSGSWLTSPTTSLRVLTSPSRVNCAATNTSAKSQSVTGGLPSRCACGRSASTPYSSSIAPPSWNRAPAATRRCPAEGHLRTRSAKVYAQLADSQFPKRKLAEVTDPPWSPHGF